ncbi:hypothetical protein TNCT_494371 [Trichonephila clavata]|uniref:Uncharacterized protein n=1 Tax=Trichonephila clavata TaxID=2740835 RepID=A0A8X6L983_TRICU|nr:hypothetical protein TNCT_494371 [Trichonephila clavata]
MEFEIKNRLERRRINSSAFPKLPKMAFSFRFPFPHRTRKGSNIGSRNSRRQDILQRKADTNSQYVYLRPNQSHLPTNFSNFMDKNTIILGDLIAQHTIWGSTFNNDRSEDILKTMDGINDEKRKRLLETFSGTGNNTRSEIKKINEELKLTYIHLKRERRKDMCSKIESRSSDSKLCKLGKIIKNELEQFKTCNPVRVATGHAYPDEKPTVNDLVAQYQFSRVPSCPCPLESETVTWTWWSLRPNALKSLHQREANTKGHDQSVLKNRLVNSEWKIGTVITLKTPGEKTCSPEEFRPIALACTSSPEENPYHGSHTSCSEDSSN